MLLRLSPMPTITIQVDGHEALTTGMAATRYGMAESTIRAMIHRYQEPAAAHLDSRPLHLAARLDELMASRPGKGNWNPRRQPPDTSPPPPD